MGSRLLVPYQYVLYGLLLKNRIVNMQRSAARVAEDVFHTFVLERANQSFTAGQQFHDHSSQGLGSFLWLTERRGYPQPKFRGAYSLWSAPLRQQAGRGTMAAT
jgi:hypothetical protein